MARASPHALTSHRLTGSSVLCISIPPIGLRSPARLLLEVRPRLVHLRFQFGQLPLEPCPILLRWRLFLYLARSPCHVTVPLAGGIVAARFQPARRSCCSEGLRVAASYMASLRISEATLLNASVSWDSAGEYTYRPACFVES
jgi:hypothetical protein